MTKRRLETEGLDLGSHHDELADGVLGVDLEGADLEDDEELEDMSEYGSDGEGSIDWAAIQKMGEEKLREEERDRLGIRHDPGSDSSEDERTNRNTVGNVPLKWYQHEDHIGYDLSGEKIIKSEKKDRLDRLLEKMDKDGLITSFHDPYNDEEIQISREDLRMLLNIKKGKLPDVTMEPYMEYQDWFTRKVSKHPVTNALKPKSSFVPSLHEERRVAQLIRAIRSGALKPVDRHYKDPDAPYMIWAEDGRYEREGSRLAYLQPPKQRLPSHEASFHPPNEYLPTKANHEHQHTDEQLSLKLMDSTPTV